MNDQDELVKVTDVESTGGINDGFGLWENIAMNDDWLVVGAPHTSVNGKEKAGAVYVFSVDGGNSFKEVAKITASDAEANDLLGGGVRLSGDTLVSGAWDWGGKGKVYVFRLQPDG